MNLESLKIWGCLIVCIAVFCLTGNIFAAGEILFSVRDGGRVREIRLSYDAERLRIDRPGNIIPAPPVNLLDLKQGTLRILHPHNGTWSEVGSRRSEVGGQRAEVGGQESEVAKPRMALPADWPKMPALPEGLPEGIGPGASKMQVPSINPGLPAGMPAFPAMPTFSMEGMGGDKPMVLVSKNQTNEFFGFLCHLYETTVPEHGIMSLWLCDAPALPPFHLLVHGLERNRPEWDEQIARLLRKKKTFPFRAELKVVEGGEVLAEWNVLSIKTNVKEKNQAELFEIPAGMHRLSVSEW